MNSTNLLHILNRFSELRILVIGDAMIDHYLCGPSNRLCREAPVPIVDVTSEMATGGGAANTAINVHNLGAKTEFLTVIGDDRAGRHLKQLLRQQGMDTDHLIIDGSRRTLSKHRISSDGQLLVRFDHGTCTGPGADVEANMLRSLERLFHKADAVIISDYGYGNLTPRMRGKLAELQASSPRLLIVDAKDPEAYREVGVTAVKPNYGEAVRLLGIEAELAERGAISARVRQIQRHGSELLARCGAQIVAVTLDHEGALIFERDRPAYRTYAQPHPDSRAAGAGDTFVCSLALALAAGAHTPAAAEIASIAAGIVVAKEGTTACSLVELRGSLPGNDKVISEREALEDQLLLLRQSGKRVVFTNGCFDILHRGHITYLSQAKELGDVLIVGLNSDESVRRLKSGNGNGPRPINGLADRAQVLAAMSCVDFVVPFSEDTPRRLIEIVQPDVFVKGGDYTRESLPEAPLVEKLGGEVRLLPYIDNLSTTSIIERIRGMDNERRTADDGKRTGDGRRPLNGQRRSAVRGSRSIAP